jgi:hypothetical protein
MTPVRALTEKEPDMDSDLTLLMIPGQALNIQGSTFVVQG